ncbi:MAG: hypothetical protein IPJ00_09405 [Saprospirales bacterium]|nr:hypothetical protein [Saprospirales bacterium]
MDIVSASTFSNNVVWFENLNGQGEYGDPRLIVDVGWFGVDYLYVADLDGDIDPDVLILKDLEYLLFSNLLKPSSFFSEPQNLQMTAGSLIIMDLNGDELPDILGQIGQNVGWFENTSGGFRIG